MMKQQLLATQFDIYLEQCKHPDQPIYNIGGKFVIKAELDIERFDRAFAVLVNSNEALRTRICVDDSGVGSYLATDPQINIEHFDFSAANLDGQTAEQALHAIKNKLFTLHDAPLFRAALMKIAEGHYWFVAVSHHIILDGWSFSMLLNDLFAYYDAATASTVTVRPQYHVLRENNEAWRQSEQHIRSMEYWQAQLADLPDILLPKKNHQQNLDEQNNSKQCSRLTRSICPEDFAKIEQLAATMNVSVMQCYTAVLSVTLAKTKGVDDILIGIPRHNRKGAVEKQVMGTAVIISPLRVKVNGQLSFVDFVATLRANNRASYPHQGVAVGDIVRSIELQKQGRDRLFDITVNYQNLDFNIDNAERSIETFFLENDYDQCPLSLTICQYNRHQSVDIQLDHRLDTLSPQQANKLFDRLDRLMAQVLDDASKPVFDYDLVLAAEKNWLIAQNNTERDFDDQCCIQQLLERQAAQTPDAVALIVAEEQLTYRELNQKINQLSRYLLQQDVQPGSVVGLMLERSIDMVVGLWAIIKSGCAYLPLDPHLPQQRLAGMVENAQTRVILSSNEFASQINIDGVRNIALDEQSVVATVAQLDSDNLDTLPLNVDDLAYVIYTSGSTGNPKGVMVSHQALVNRIQWMQNEYPLDANDRVLQKTPFNFDVSVWEFTWPFICGAALVMAKPEGHKDPIYLHQMIEQHQITTLHFVPSMLNAMLAAVDWGQLSSVKRVFCSGEALPGDVVQQFFDTQTRAELHNLYGPTEAAIDVSYWQCQPNVQKVPIGRPIQNIQLWVLSPQMDLLPPGEVGELHIAGVGLAKGYLNAKALSDEKFVPWITPSEQSVRVYKTGDLVRWSDDGTLEYLGRTDHQVKLNGLRLELGEIETKLYQLPAISECVVTVHQPEGKSPFLLAYVAQHANETLTQAQIITQLSNTLPDYMVPKHYVFVDALPLSANGKIDRKKLPPYQDQGAQTNTFIAPTNALESQLCKLWQDVLKVEQVGITDNFYSLGGDSIMAISLAAKARQQGINLQVQDFLRAANIQVLASKATDGTALDNSDEISVKPFELIDTKRKATLPNYAVDAFPLSALQAGMIFHTHLNEDSAVYHDIFSCLLAIEWQPEVFAATLVDMAQNHDALRSYIDLSDDQPLQIVAASDHAKVPYEYIDLRHLAADQQQIQLNQWREALKQQRFDFNGQQLLYRLYIHHCDDSKVQYTLSFHHALLDGWSVASLTTQLFDNYLARLKGRKVKTDATTPYREFIALEQKVVGSANARDFWQQKLADAPINQLPRLLADGNNSNTTQPSPEQTSTAQNSVKRSMSVELLSAIAATAKQFGVHEKSLMLAAHFKVLSLMFGQDKVSTCLVSNGRPNNINAQVSLGLFLNSLPLTMDLAAHDSWQQLVKAAEALTLESYPYRRFPYAEIQRLSQLDFSEVLFNYVNFHVYDQLNANPDFTLLDYDFYEETNFNLLVQIVRNNGTQSLDLELIYNGQLFDQSLMNRYAGYFTAALQSLVDAEHPAKAGLIDPSELNRLSEQFNDTHVAYDQSLCVAELLARQAVQNPQLTAVVHEGQTLNWQQLNEQANQLAHWLINQGVVPDTPVGIGFERSIEMVVAIWGVLKAGGAYVPLEPGYPAQRLLQIKQDAQFEIMLSSQQHANSFAFDDVNLVSIDSEAFKSQWQQQSTENPQVEGLTSQHLAYIIFTSGSTGRPKGVMVSHQALHNRIDWMQREYPLSAAHKILQKTPYTFDVSVWEFIWPALSSATLVMAKANGHKDPQYLAQVIQQQQITTLHFVPSMLQMLLAETQFAQLTSVEQVFCSGEALPVELHKRFVDTGTKAQLHNLYGPTEAAIDVTYWACGQSVEQHSVPIGHPIQNIKLYIVDQQNRLCPTGVAGELLITGDGLARGYINRPDLTTERFIDWPLPNGEQVRAYRTGDLACWTEQGYIEYLGRTDHQVKIRGLRIELAEIETHLLAFDAIREVTVLPRKNRSGEDILVAFLVAGKDIDQTRLDKTQLDQYLAPKLPQYMVPDIYHRLDVMPLGHSGKVDRKALLQIELFATTLQKNHTLQQNNTVQQNSVAQQITKLWQTVLNVDAIAPNQSWRSLGATSLDAVKLARHMSNLLAQKIKVVQLFQFTTANQWAEYLTTELAVAPVKAVSRRDKSEGIAIIGMSGMFGGKNNINDYWQALLEGEMLVRDLDQQELTQAGVADDDWQNNHYVRRRAPINDPLHFDNQFFGYAAREAQLMDPQLRLMHQEVWHALEDGGYAPDKTDLSIGLYGGAGNNHLWQSYVMSNAYARMSDWFEVNSLADREFYMTRIAHSLGLTGPAVNIQSACSTSLVAVHSAICAMRNGDCDMAVVCAGAVQPVNRGYLFQEGMIASPDGICRPFDSSANGTVPGEGVAAILLKPLQQAIDDKDQIRSVIHGSAINNDGKAKVGYTAPSVQGQASVIAAALADANLNPEQISYIETHGTGTVMGDPIEMAALNQVFAGGGQNDTENNTSNITPSCALGAVKANIGHLDAAAGLAGLIKTTLALENAMIPPVINFQQLNPECDLQKSSFSISATKQPWQGKQRFAGISSFGIGGTNAHLILGEKPQWQNDHNHRIEQLVTLSAYHPDALAQLAEKLATELANNDDLADVNLADIVYSLNIGRSDKTHRVGLVCDHKSVLLSQLQSMARNAHAQPMKPMNALVYMFTGQGSQYIGMYREVYQQEPVFSQMVDHCFARLTELGQPGLAEYLDHNNTPLVSIDRTDITQSLLFVCQFALAHLLAHWGVKPTAIIGHSVGELIGACIAGVMSLNDALFMVYHRGRLMQQTQPGSMMAVHLPADLLASFLSDELALAAKNSAELSVVSGTDEAITAMAQQLDSQGIKHRLLHTSHAYHSPMMQSAADEFAKVIAQIKFAEPQLPLISNITGDWAQPSRICSAEYWVEHILQPVNFADGVSELLLQQDVTFLELGPGRTLATFVRNHHHREDAVVIETIPGAKEQRSARQNLLLAMATLYQHGGTLNWRNFYQHESCRRLSLPTYPFAKVLHDAMLPEPGSQQQPTAKLDRLEDVTVPTQPQTSQSRSVPYVKASTATEQVLVEIWQKLFQLDAIGVYDNFFDIGGHSLMATTMLSQINQQYGTSIKLHGVMNSQTIIELATLIDNTVGGNLPVESGDKKEGNREEGFL